MHPAVNFWSLCKHGNYEMAVFEIKDRSLVLTELFSPYSIEEVTEKTGCEFLFASEIRKIR